MERLVKVATPLAVLTLVVPPSIAPAAPVPLLMAMLTVAVEVVAVLPKASCRTTTGWVVKATFLLPPPGWLLKARLVAVPGFTVNAALVPASGSPGGSCGVMVVPDWTLVMVTLCGSSTPFVKAAVVPPPEERVALEVITTLLLPLLKLVTVLLNASRAVTRRLKATPAVWAPMAPPPEASTRKDERAPATSVSVPKFVPAGAPLMDEVPLFVMLPLASGAPAVGRTLIPDQVILPRPLPDVDCCVTVIVIVVAVGVTVWEVPPPTCKLVDDPLAFVTVAVTELAAVENSKPAGAFRMMVPVPMSPTAPSVRTGPVRVVKAPVPLVAFVSAEMALPPVAAVTVVVLLKKSSCELRHAQHERSLDRVEATLCGRDCPPLQAPPPPKLSPFAFFLQECKEIRGLFFAPRWDSGGLIFRASLGPEKKRD